MAQTAAVMAALANASAPLDAAALAARFRQGRRVEPKIASVLGALLRMGFMARRPMPGGLRIEEGCVGAGRIVLRWGDPSR